MYASNMEEEDIARIIFHHWNPLADKYEAPDAPVIHVTGDFYIIASLPFLVL